MTLTCKCGWQMSWENKVASEHFYNCYECHRRAIIRFDGDIWWWSVEEIEKYVEEDEEATA